jgi:hypothetical protein
MPGRIDARHRKHGQESMPRRRLIREISGESSARISTQCCLLAPLARALLLPDTPQVYARRSLIFTIHL